MDVEAMNRKKDGQKSQCTRRSFLKSTGAFAAGLAVAGRPTAGAAKGTLALFGGPKAVTYPNSKHAEAEWWHHRPHIPELPGSEEAYRTAMPLHLFTSEAPDLVDQYVKAFRKVWAHRKELAKA